MKSQISPAIFFLAKRREAEGIQDSSRSEADPKRSQLP